MDVPGNDSLIEGKATFTIVASRNARNAPKDATISTRAAGTRADCMTHRLPQQQPGRRQRILYQDVRVRK